MRNSVFRGWDATGQKGWVFGDLVHNQKVTKTGLEPRTMVGGYEVFPESVGQFTGLRDEAGNRIFEGDMVEWKKDSKKYLVVFRSGMFYASVEEFNENVYGGFPLWFLCEEEQHCNVIGTIYEQRKEK